MVGAPSVGVRRTSRGSSGAGSSASDALLARGAGAGGAAAGWIAPGTSVSQYGQIVHCGSSGLRAVRRTGP